MRTLILGGHGQLGCAFAAHLPAATSVGRNEVDLTNAAQIERAITSTNPDIVINCAAFTDVDAAESEEAIALAVNAGGPRILAEACSRAGALLVSFSTDHVFAGNEHKTYVESDATGPVNVYGATKLAGESAILQAANDALIVRTAWLMSSTHRCFAHWVIETALKGPLRVVDDQYGTPSWSNDVAATTIQLIERGARGVMHVVNSETMSKFDVARHLVLAAGIPERRLSRAKTSEFPRPAARPESTPLRSERLSEFGVSPLGPWSSKVRAVVREVMGSVEQTEERP